MKSQETHATDRREIASKPGADVVDAQLLLGQLALDRGEYHTAIDWFRIAARSGDPRGYNMLGRCFERGWGTAVDARRAAAHYRRAAKLGDAWGMFNLADLFARGFGVERNEREAYRLYTEAARLGLLKALNMIGLFYEDGRVVGRDRAQARAFFLSGAEGGDCWAQFNYARLLIEDGDIESALPWLERTFESGFPDFWANLRIVFIDHADHRLADIAQRAHRMSSSARS